MPDDIQIAGSTLWVDSGANTPPSSSQPPGEISSYSLTGTPTGTTLTVPRLGSAHDPDLTVSGTFAAGAAGIVAETESHQIMSWSSAGAPGPSWGSLSPANVTPAGVFSDAGGNVYVLDGANPRIVRFDAATGAASVFADLSAIDRPNYNYTAWISAAVTPGGEILVLSDDTLTTVDTSGQIVSTVPISCVFHCEQIAVAPDGNVYARDDAGIEVFTPAGVLIQTLRIHATALALGPSGDVYAQVPPDLAVYSPAGVLLSAFAPRQPTWPPGGSLTLTVDPNGDFVAAGSGVRVYSPTGTLLAYWPDPDQEPSSISVSPDGHTVNLAGSYPTTTIERYTGVTIDAPPTDAAGPTGTTGHTSLPATAPVQSARPSGAASPSPQRIVVLSLRQLKQRAVMVRIRCLTIAGMCRGRLELVERALTRIARRIRSAHQTAAVVLGTKSFAVRNNARAVVHVPLTRTARRLLGAGHRVRATLEMTIAGSKTRSRTVTLTG